MKFVYRFDEICDHAAVIDPIDPLSAVRNEHSLHGALRKIAELVATAGCGARKSLISRGVTVRACVIAAGIEVPPVIDYRHFTGAHRNLMLACCELMGDRVAIAQGEVFQMKFVVHTPETASPQAGEVLKRAERAFGFIPNLLGVLAEAPIALQAYIDLTELLGKASLNAVEQQVMMLAVSYENSCGYCMAAHSTVAGMTAMPKTVLKALRSGVKLPDPKLEALRSFAVDVVRSRGRVSDQRIEKFLSAGYHRQNVLEVVFAVAMKTLSNYVNNMAETPVDAQFMQQVWGPQFQSA